MKNACRKALYFFPIFLLAFATIFLTINIVRTSADSTAVSDDFTRSVSSGWSSATTGGAYTLTGTASDFNVNGSEGTMNAPTAGTARAAQLLGVSTTANDINFKVKADKLAVGTAQEIFFIVRQVDASNYYRGKVRLTPTNTVTVQMSKVVGGVETFFGSQTTVSGLTNVANSYIRVRSTVTGTNPTTVQIKAWVDGNAEPGSWNYTSTDSEAVLQASGSTGLRVNLPGSTANSPVLFTFDDYSNVTSDVLPTPTPSPTASPQAGTAFLTDTFTRSGTDTWGTPDTGGSYVVTQGSAVDYDTTGSVGTINTTGAAVSHGLIENNATQRDVDVQFDVKTDKIPSSSAAEVFWLARRVDASNQYRGKVRLTSSSGVTLQATKYVNGVETALGSQVLVSGLTLTADTFVSVRSQVTGVNPTTMNMKAWLAGTTEPVDWQYTVTDSEVVLQVQGGFGFRTNIPSGVSNTPILLSFDNINATTQDAGVVAPTPEPQAGTVVAMDTYTRTTSNAWGSANTGGAYTLVTGAASNFAVTGAEGTMQANVANVTRAVALDSVLNLDVDMQVKMKVNTTPVGNAAEVFLTTRRTDTNNQYRGKVRFSATNTITLQAANVIAGVETLLGTQANTGITYANDQYIYVRQQVIGTQPTSIRMKAWIVGQTEPIDWQYAFDDYQELSLQGPGSIGLRVNIPGTVSNPPITVTFDDLNVTSTDVDVPNPTNEPVPTPTATPASSLTATVNLAGTPTVSKLSVGVTHIQESMNSGGDATAITNAKSLLTAGVSYENQHIVGFGVSNLWDDPSKTPSQWNWDALDRRVKFMRQTGNTPILTLCCAPTWMVDSTWSPGKYTGGSNTDWSKIEEAPLVAYEDDYAYMVAQIVSRYDGVTLDDTSTPFPRILYFQVWNEMKGLWYSTGNRWDYARYNRLYGKIYDAIKLVRSDANIGGPYVRMAGYLHPNASQNSSVTGASFGTVDKRNLDVVTQWLTWLTTHLDSNGQIKAQFLVVDGGINVKDVTDGSFPTDIFAASEYYTAVDSWMNSEMTNIIGTQLPMWWAEDYMGKVNGPSVQITPENKQPPALAMMLYKHLYGGTALSLRWGGEEQLSTSGVAQGNKQNLFSSTKFGGGGQQYLNYDVYKNFNDYFAAGTSVYPVNISPSSSELTVLASSTKALLINKGTSTLTVDLVQSTGTTQTTLTAYEVQLMDVPNPTPTPTPSPTPTPTPDTENPTEPGTPTTTTPTGSTTQNWSWTAGTDAISGVSHYAWRVITNLGAAVVQGTSDVLSAITNLTQGIYTFFVKTVDNQGNESAESSSSVTVDTNAPTVVVTPYTPDPTSDTTPTFTGTATDSISSLTSIEYQIDSGSWSACTADDGTIDELEEAFTCAVSALSDGSYDIHVRATDSLSHTSNGSGIGSDHFTVNISTPTPADDVIAPTSPGTPTTTTPTNATSQNWVWSAGTDGDSGVSHYAWRVTTSLGGAVTNSTSVTTSQPTNLIEGSYIFYVKTVDNAGNESSESTGSLTVDTTAPNISLNTYTPDPTTDDTPTFTGTATDTTTALTAIQYRVDTGVWSACSADDGDVDEISETFSCTTTSLADATYTITVRAIDGVSNISSGGELGSDSLTVDAIADPTPTPTPTATPTPSNNSGSSSGTSGSSNDSTSSFSICSNAKPSSAADLFQINPGITGVKLFFNPGGGPHDRYMVSYGTTVAADMYSFEFQHDDSGVIAVDVESLARSTTYYFRVRASNACTPGDWSTVIAVKTGQRTPTYKWSSLGRIITTDVSKRVRPSTVPTIPVQSSQFSTVPLADPTPAPQSAAKNVVDSISNFFRKIFQ